MVVEGVSPAPCLHALCLRLRLSRAASTRAAAVRIALSCRCSSPRRLCSAGADSPSAWRSSAA
eukprot:6201324-Pleurochrysis_carterae.AAC.3